MDAKNVKFPSIFGTDLRCWGGVKQIVVFYTNLLNEKIMFHDFSWFHNTNNSCLCVHFTIFVDWRVSLLDLLVKNKRWKIQTWKFNLKRSVLTYFVFRIISVFKNTERVEGFFLRMLRLRYRDLDYNRTAINTKKSDWGSLRAVNVYIIFTPF